MGLAHWASSALLHLHCGCPSHLPSAAFPLPAAGAAAQVPFQRYSIAAEDGSPVFVDPSLYALALRMPLKDCLEQSIRWGGGERGGKRRCRREMCATAKRVLGQAAPDAQRAAWAVWSQRLTSCALHHALSPPRRGVEFVLKTADSHWLQQGHNQGNFYAELPLPMR